MANIEEEKQMQQSLRSLLSQIASIKLEQLERGDLGVELNFRSGLPYFERILNLFKELSESNLDIVSFERLKKLHGHAQNVITAFNNVRGFSVQQHQMNPTQSRDQIIEKIRQSYEQYFNDIALILSISARTKTSFGDLEREASTAVDKVKAILIEQEKASKIKLSELDATLDQVRRAAQEAGVAQHAIHFQQEADEHKDAARRWLITTGVLIISTLIAGYFSLSYLLDKLSTISLTQSIQLTVTKIVIFSLLFTAIVWSGRIYRAHRHNYVVNKHRQNALSTFETFVKAANDEQTKSAVLLQTTNCIFSPQHTGYIAHEQESAGYPQILEIIRGMAGPQSKT